MVNVMFSQLFGKYLVANNVITDDDYKDIIEKQLSVRVKLGTIAIAQGLLTEEQVETINELQKQFDRRFGDIAVEKELLSAEQIDALLQKQGNPYMQFLEVLLESGKVKASAIDNYLASFQKENGFSDADMAALKNDDIDKLIPIFAVSAKPYVAELAALVIRNINRFVTRDFYIEKMKHLHTLKYSHLTGQRLVGDDSLYLALADESDQSAFVKIASAFSGNTYVSADEDAFDAVCEFININSGLFASEASKKKITLDMEPTFAYKDQSVDGDFYILPIYIENHAINLLIAVNSDMKMGDTPFYYSSEIATTASHRTDSKGTILVVDDSKMSRNMLRALVEDAGYSVVAEAGDGEAAIEAYKQSKPDLVTLDITMPKMDGIEALKHIIKINPSAKVIMITAAGQENKLIEAIKVGAERFVTKPFDKEEVLKCIQEILMPS